MASAPVNSMISLLRSIDSLYGSIVGRVRFDEEGWPLFQESHFLEDWPQSVVTYENRTSRYIKDKARTLLCFYTSDAQIHLRLSRVWRDIAVYREYAGIVFPDLTVTADMDIEMQEATILANHLFAAALIAEGIKVVFNTRCGELASQQSFRNIPRGVMCAPGFLGCPSSPNAFSASIYVNKILSLMPSRLIIYGKRDEIVNRQMDVLGINYRYYDDFHSLCKRRIV